MRNAAPKGVAAAVNGPRVIEGFQIVGARISGGHADRARQAELGDELVVPAVNWGRATTPARPP
ncbi:MAG TPA: hypothetical protein VG225_08030 [Terracidiphilus sp.]|jgi:hypothetical protein|nr:hypothetical protein [Terracidiphilus sp.]